MSCDILRTSHIYDLVVLLRRNRYHLSNDTTGQVTSITSYDDLMRLLGPKDRCRLRLLEWKFGKKIFKSCNNYGEDGITCQDYFIAILSKYSSLKKTCENQGSGWSKRPTWVHPRCQSSSCNVLLNYPTS